MIAAFWAELLPATAPAPLSDSREASTVPMPWRDCSWSDWWTDSSGAPSARRRPWRRPCGPCSEAPRADGSEWRQATRGLADISAGGDTDQDILSAASRMRRALSTSARAAMTLDLDGVSRSPASERYALSDSLLRRGRAEGLLQLGGERDVLDQDGFHLDPPLIGDLRSSSAPSDLRSFRTSPRHIRTKMPNAPFRPSARSPARPPRARR